jgi:NAD(P)-dependent dehydrogenase (short-subunit alcohol dehydrogenase family)
MNGKRILLTGAAGAFGRAIAAEVSATGATVVGVDRAPGADLRCDITDRAAVDAAVGKALERLGGLDVLVNNAGLGTAGPAGDGPSPEDREVLEANFLGAWNMASAALPALLASRGQLINVASLLAVVPLPLTTAYTASKRALCALSDTLRAEHGGRLAVATVYPGYVRTPIHTAAEARSGASLHGMAPEETPAHVARAVARAIRRRPRDQATTRGGAVVLRVVRAAPGVPERVIALRTRHMLAELDPYDERPTSDPLAR